MFYFSQEEMEVTEVNSVPKASKSGNVLSMSKREKFNELIKTLKTLPFKDSNTNSIDVTAMQFGIVPMAVYRKLDKKRDEDDCLSCELYLDNTFITSGKIPVPIYTYSIYFISQKHAFQTHKYILPS